MTSIDLRNNVMKKAIKETDSHYIDCLINLMLGLQIQNIGVFIISSKPMDYKNLGIAYYQSALKKQEIKEQENEK